jgi:hypothetical protein
VFSDGHVDQPPPEAVAPAKIPWREYTPGALAILGGIACLVMLILPADQQGGSSGPARALQAQVSVRGSILSIRNLERARWNRVTVDVETGRSNGTFHYQLDFIAAGAEARIPLSAFSRADGASLDSLRHAPSDIRIEVAWPAGEFRWHRAWGVRRQWPSSGLRASW